MVRFPCWHVLKLEFWHFVHPQLNFAFAFASVFAVFYSKKVRQPASCTVQKHINLCISHRFFGVFLCVSHFASVFTVFLPTLDFLHMPAWTCICLSALCGGWGGGGGGDDVHVNATLVSVSCVRLVLVCSGAVHWWGGGGWSGVMTSMRMRLLFSVSCVHLVLVCSGALHWWGWGVYR